MNTFTGYYDKDKQPIFELDYLSFDNGSYFQVLKNKNNFVLRKINDNLPLLLLSKITFGNTIFSAKKLEKIN